MYLSEYGFRTSTTRLGSLHPFFGFSYLALKRARLPVGETVELNFSALVDRHLHEYFKPDPLFKGYYSPFSSSRPSSRWLAPRYGSTSLQRITVDTFGECFLHPKSSSIWGWTENYVEILETYLVEHGSSIPAFELAAWMFRGDDLGHGDVARESLERFREIFVISNNEWKRLFNVSVPDDADKYFSDSTLPPDGMLALLGGAAKKVPVKPLGIESIRLSGVGPAESLSYEPADRINLITGDNSAGKTFLLDSVWWALTGTWAGGPFVPPLSAARLKPSMALSLKGSPRKLSVESAFDWGLQSWSRSMPQRVDSLVIYARSNGSFAIWDGSAPSPDGYDALRSIRLSTDEVRMGSVLGGRNVCNGLYRDLVAWQTNPTRFASRWSAFDAAITAMSPPDSMLRLGEPYRSVIDDIELPTLMLPYGEVPLTQASSGIARVLGLIYVLIWSWFRHAEFKRLVDDDSESRIVILVDELEAHLHPRWQRTVLPSLTSTISKIAPAANIQAHVVTHSPLIVASLEALYDEYSDAVMVMEIEEASVNLVPYHFEKLGRFDKWFTSDVFGLRTARSVVAEKAVLNAREAILSKGAGGAELIERVHRELQNSLGPDDEFWARWLPFASEFISL